MKMHSPKYRQYYSGSSRRLVSGFTLVEMLIVITIITILLTVGAMGLKNMTKSSGVGAGLPIAEGIFAEARALAIGKGTEARVLIHAENNPQDELHRERFLRYMIVQYLDTRGTDEAADDRWVTASRGVTLPKGVYFVKKLSESSGLTLNTETNVTLPGKSDSKCYYYKFNSEGMINDPVRASGDEDNNDVPRFVIRAGSLPPGADEPKAIGGAKKNVGGFVIWRSGRTSLFQHPNQIDQSL